MSKAKTTTRVHAALEMLEADAGLRVAADNFGNDETDDSITELPSGSAEVRCGLARMRGVVMRALTLTQGWAGLVAAGVKRVENRPRRMIRREQIGEQFAIHASREISKEAIRRIVEISPDLMNPDRDWMRLCHVTSAILAVTTLQDIWLVGGCSRETIEEMCERAGMPDQARFVFGPVVYVLRDTVALNVPIPCRGWQGFWTMESQLEVQVRAQIPGGGAP